MSELELTDYVRDLEMTVERVCDYAYRAAEHAAEGNLDAAARVLETQGGKVDELVGAWADLQRHVRAAGGDPSRR